MKTKRILIAYLNNGDIKNLVARERTFEKVVDELREEGRSLDDITRTIDSTKATFEDGSKVIMQTVNINSRNSRITHLYVDESIKSMQNGWLLIQTVLMPSLMMGEYKNFDTSGKQLVFFSHEDGEIKLTNLNGDVV